MLTEVQMQQIVYLGMQYARNVFDLIVGYQTHMLAILFGNKQLEQYFRLNMVPGIMCII